MTKLKNLSVKKKCTKYRSEIKFIAKLINSIDLQSIKKKRKRRINLLHYHSSFLPFEIMWFEYFCFPSLSFLDTLSVELIRSISEKNPIKKSQIKSSLLSSKTKNQ